MSLIPDVTIWCPSVRPEFLAELSQVALPYKVEEIPQQFGTSFSSLCNWAIWNTKSKYVIICNDKARPKPADFEKMLNLLESDFGFVGLYRFGFFGLRSALGRELGGFDERFVDGGYEDVDMLIKLKQSDVKVFMSEEIDYVDNITSTWNQKLSAEFFNKKYQFDVVNKVIIQQLPHENNLLASKKKSSNGNGFRGSELCLIPFIHKTNNFSKVLMEFNTKFIGD